MIGVIIDPIIISLKRFNLSIKTKAEKFLSELLKKLK